MLFSKLFKSRNSKMIGIDIGSHSVKAILLDKSSDDYQVEAFAMLPIAKGAIVDHNITDIEAIGGVLKKLRRRFPKSVTNAAVAVSGSGVITKTIYLSAVHSDDELEAQIEVEADHLIPYPLNEVNLDFEKLKQADSKSNKVGVLLAAARTELVEARVSALEIGKLEAKVMDIEAYALARSYSLIKNQLPPDAEQQPIAMLNIGAAMLTIAVVEQGETTFIREQAFGGDQYTQSILSYYDMKFEDAEAAKVDGNLPENSTLEVLDPFKLSLVQQVRRTLQIYETSSSGNKVSHLVISGGCAYLEGIDSLIAQELAIETIIAKPIAASTVADNMDGEQFHRQSAKFMVACGLALRSFC